MYKVFILSQANISFTPEAQYIVLCNLDRDEEEEEEDNNDTSIG